MPDLPWLEEIRGFVSDCDKEGIRVHSSGTSNPYLNVAVMRLLAHVDELREQLGTAIECVVAVDCSDAVCPTGECPYKSPLLDRQEPPEVK